MDFAASSNAPERRGVNKNSLRVPIHDVCGIVGTYEEAVVIIIGKARQELSRIAREFTVEALSSGSVPVSIDQALKDSGTDRQRQSPLQPRLMMWLMLCLPLFRSESIPAVLARLISGLRDMVLGLSLWPVDDGAISHARKRLGVDPLRRFFRDQARQIRPSPSFHGYRVWSLDGSTLTMPDTADNRRVFGRPKASRGRCGFPHLKVVGLQDVAARLFRDVTWRRWNAAERPMAIPLLGHLGEGDLVLLDRGFYGVWFFEAIRARGSQFLCRVSELVKLKAIDGTSKNSGDYVAWIEARIPLPNGQKVQGPCGRPATHRRAGMKVRVIEYRMKGFRRVRLVTSVLDPSISARDWVLEYHRRWEIELALDEMKTHQSSTAQGTPKTIFRSQTARNVMQEAYALVAAYNLVRATIASAARRKRIAPDKISFIGALRAITHMLPRMRGARAEFLRELYEQLIGDVGEALIDRPRRPRRYPRVVKVKMSNYALKRRHHRQTCVDFRQTIRIGA